MTIPKAVAMLQDFIEFKLRAATVLRDGSPQSSVGDLARQYADLHDQERGMIEQILKELDSEPKMIVKAKSESNIKDLIVEEVRIQLAEELKKLNVKHDTKRKKKSL